MSAECGAKYYCNEMVDCAEAAFFFAKCGLGRLDGDGDGIPCETLCGGSRALYQLRRAVQSKSGLYSEPFACGHKSQCSEMVSCEEARFYLKTCAARRLDGDSDGVPCESLCR